MNNRILMPGILIRESAFFPGMTVNLTVVQKKAIESCISAIKGEQFLFVGLERTDVTDGRPSLENINSIGTVTKIKQMNKMPGGSVQIVIECLYRARLTMVSCVERLLVEVEPINENDISDRIEKEAVLRTIRETYIKYMLINPGNSKTVSKDELADVTDLSEIIDRVLGNIALPSGVKVELLVTENNLERARRLIGILQDEIQVIAMQEKIRQTVKDKAEKTQKDYYLREQMNVIRKQLGEDGQSDEEEYLEKLDALNVSDEIREKIKKEIKRLSTLNNSGSEAQVERGYIETLLELPWDKASEDNNDIKHAREVLDADHYGLEKIKERILEFLAVRALSGKGDGSIICLVGPPGTGKTSIARSVADALNKKYVRVCLGGVRDEAEIRGHRRTYVGAMPGVIVEGIKNAGVKNPLMLLDEIDKVGSDRRGDTASALLEVLDSEQNSKFKDHYISLPIDLSEVFFIATANSLSEIPKPLLDRMEVIEVSSYTSNEKFHIARDYLVKKQIKKNGLLAKQLHISDSAINKIIESYTREAGVRELERKIGEIARKAARQILEGEAVKVSVTAKNLSEYLGKEKFRKDSKNKKNEVGIVRGLAWTAVGGDTLQIEVNVMPGKGNIDLTGQMGDVMKESAHIGLSYIRSIASSYKIRQDFFTKHDIHLHIPEGAVPKDGPSAGITMATAMLSAIAGIPVDCNIAMTGEITLRGKVLPVGGLKEKMLAAKTAGIMKVFVPKDNESDIMEIPEEIREGMTFVFVSDIKEVLKEALIN